MECNVTVITKQFLSIIILLMYVICKAVNFNVRDTFCI